MKVDLGQCAVCGAKNSKYVEKCYKCGATLPWAPGYVAPKNAPQKPAPQPVVAPTDAPTDAGAKTVVIPPADNTSRPAPILETDATPNAPTISERAQNKVPVPAWALGVGGVGLLILGMALWALLGKKPAPTTVVAAPTPVATTVALAPIVTGAGPTLAPTAATTASPTAMPTVEPTPTATAAPVIVAPVVVAPAPDVAGVPGPTFDELYANLTTGMPQQQALYWDAVKGKTINWRGEFVSLGSAASGPLVVNCKNAGGALKVTVNLDVAKPQTLPSFAPNQSVPFAGTLESHNAGEITIKNGRVN